MQERRRGVILNIASNTSLRAFPLTAYGPGKAAVMALTEILAAELGPYYVRVNAVAPTACLTPPLQARIDAGERDWFRLLTTVQGVGARVALAILTVLGPAEITDAVIAQDKTVFTQAAGVGPKLAARIVAELKDRVGDLIVIRPIQFAGEAAGDSAGPVGDAISALVNLGYRRIEAYGAVSQAASRLGSDAAIEALITAGLKELGG